MTEFDLQSAKAHVHYGLASLRDGAASLAGAAFMDFTPDAPYNRPLSERARYAMASSLVAVVIVLLERAEAGDEQALHELGKMLAVANRILRATKKE